MMKKPAVNLALLLLGLTLQAIAAFEYAALEPVRVGLMGLSSSLLVLADWRTLKDGAKQAILPLLIVAVASSLTSCAWMGRRATDARDCVAETGKAGFRDLLPNVRAILAEPSWERVQSALVKLATEYGKDFVWCLVARAKSDAMMLGSDGSGVNGQVAVNAERWMNQ